MPRPLPLFILAATLAGPFSNQAEAAASPKAGQRFRDCKNCPEMVVVPAGRFVMGAPEGEIGREPDEGPQHEVVIGKPFAVARFQTLASEWNAYLRDTRVRIGDGDPKDAPGCKAGKPSYAQGPKQPAVCMDWSEANGYVAWLAKKTGKPYRLLSEAEREYAARGGDQNAFPFPFDSEGQYDIARHANTYGAADGYNFSSPAGSFPANAFGLYDMHGNVWEWVADCVNRDYVGAPTDGGAWLKGECDLRMIRGNDWSSAPVFSRSANRNHTIPEDRADWLGFRVARDL
ncbi:formylglycine-generating enzyme family protein [Pseudomonas sp. RIT-PI-AD]|uniref:formylglycine-generating enzyme family protein n=1 Tax=Pseudomonas sp. RIT-PI-AD TaxID=3035294 RepID=UPI0021D91307|nr:formylglycine-generating enzyme family protein [Pseudomonas sp. RIT-PI-AD]